MTPNTPQAIRKTPYIYTDQYWSVAQGDELKVVRATDYDKALAQIEALASTNKDLQQRYADLNAAHDRVRDELAAAKRDGERYRARYRALRKRVGLSPESKDG